MFVLVTHDSTGHPRPDLHPHALVVDPASMVWVDRDELRDDEVDGLDLLRSDDDEEHSDQEAAHLSMRVFGPFETYDQAKLVAMTLPADASYWVIPVEPVRTLETRSIA